MNPQLQSDIATFLQGSPCTCRWVFDSYTWGIEKRPCERCRLLERLAINAPEEKETK